MAWASFKESCICDLPSATITVHGQLRLRRREPVSKHGKSALRLLLRDFILERVPVLDENAVRDADNIPGDPGARPAVAGETAVQEYVVTVDGDHVILVAQLGWRRF